MAPRADARLRAVRRAAAGAPPVPLLPGHPAPAAGDRAEPRDARALYALAAPARRPAPAAAGRSAAGGILEPRRREIPMATSETDALPASNEEATAAWDGPLFERFVSFRHIVTVGLGDHGEEAMRRFPPAAGQPPAGRGLRLRRHDAATRRAGRARGRRDRRRRGAALRRAGGAGGRRRPASPTRPSRCATSRSTIWAGPTTWPSPASGPCSSRARSRPCATSAAPSPPAGGW